MSRAIKKIRKQISRGAVTSKTSFWKRGSKIIAYLIVCCLNRRKDEFYTVIDLCHDERLAHTIYAHSTIRASIDAAQKSFPRTTFRKGIFFSHVPISKIYGREIQRDTIARILDSTKLANQYIPEKGSKSSLPFIVYIFVFFTCLF